MTNDSGGCALFMEKETILVSQRLNYVINFICNIHLTSFKAYRETVTKIFEYSYLAPLVINSSTIFLFTKGYKNYNNIAINYNKIKKIKTISSGIILIFESGNILNINMTIKTYFKTVKRINIISDYITKINY